VIIVGLCTLKCSVGDPDPGSGALLTPGSAIRNRFFPDPGPLSFIAVLDPGTEIQDG